MARVVVIEVARHVERRLLALGHEVVLVTSNVREALAAIESLRPDLVLLDARLDGAALVVEVFRTGWGMPVAYFGADASGSPLDPIPEGAIDRAVEAALGGREVSLGQRERFIATALDSMDEAVITFDAAGRVSFMNPRAEVVTGWLRAEAAGRTLEELVAQRVQSARRQAIDDRLLPVGRLAAGIAHEINNPLSYVVANLSFSSGELAKLRRDLGGQGQPELSAQLDEVEQALSDARHGAERIRRIIGDLRVFSRADDEPRRRVDLRAAIEAAVNATASEVGNRARLICELFDVPVVEAPQARLVQVLTNLIQNAAQAIPEGNPSRNEVVVTARTDSSGRAVVEVRDTGHGIEPGKLEHVFDPFFTTKPVGSGMGLGLSICHGLIHGLGGELSVESRVGEGSVFRVALPPAEEAAAAVETPARPAPARRRILVIDDEPMVCRSIARVLAATYDVVAQHSARAALEALRAGDRYDLVLCDLMMPELTGMELFAQLEQVAPDVTGRMVFLTGGIFSEDARQFLAACGRPFLEKPFQIDALEAMVREQLLAGSEPRCP